MRMEWPHGTLIRRVCLGCFVACSLGQTLGPSDDWVRLNNLAAAQLDNREGEKAVEAAGRAVAALETALADKAGDAAAVRELRTSLAVAQRNLARAHLLAGAYDSVSRDLKDRLSDDVGDGAARYLTGLALLKAKQAEEAAARLADAVRLDPFEAAPRFQLAQALEAAGRHEEALARLQETVRLDPLHASAHYQLALAARKANDVDRFKAHMAEFMRIRAILGEGATAAPVLEQCQHTRAEYLPAEALGSGVPVAPSKLRFVDAGVRFFQEAEAVRADAAAVLALRGDGGYDLTTILLRDGADALLLSTSVQTHEAGIRSRPIILKALQSAADEQEKKPADGEDVAQPPAESRTAAAGRLYVGDFFDPLPEGTRFDPRKHALPDLLLLRNGELKLYLAEARDRFLDVTSTALPAGIASGETSGKITCAAWADLEHDGDLDLILGSTRKAQILQNNGDGRFVDATAQMGFAAAEFEADRPVLGILAADLDRNAGVDVLFLRGDRPTMIFMNQRAGRFAREDGSTPTLPSADLGAIADLDFDGYPDVILAASGALRICRIKAARRDAIPLPENERLTALTLLDADNDGRVEILLATEPKPSASDPTAPNPRPSAARPSLHLFRMMGSGSWVDMAKEWGLSSEGASLVHELIPADLDGDADTDLLLITGDGRLRILANDGGHRNGQIKLLPIPTKTNPSGHGAFAELFAGTRHSSRIIDGPVVELGLGGQSVIDALRVTWTNGVVESLIQPPMARVIEIEERNVPTGSCPFLYAWDGSNFRFITDLLGNSPVGLPLSREVLLPADPDEIVEIGPASSFPANEAGRLELEITSEFREVLYLDEARLIAVDHPANVEVHPTDKIMPPPFPPSEVWALGRLRSLLSAQGDDGVDRTEAVAALDGRFCEPPPPLTPQLRGMGRPLILTLDFGSPASDPSSPSNPSDPSLSSPISPGAKVSDRPLILALTGWLQYGDASAQIALSQNGSVRVAPPFLEVEEPGGGWNRLSPIVGMPAGKTKTILVDLGGEVAKELPLGWRRLRLTTSFEIRWDRIALFERLPQTTANTHVALITKAILRFRGFSRLHNAQPDGPLVPIYEETHSSPPWRTAVEGWCTPFGDVASLIERRDGRLAVINGGDAVRLGVDVAILPPIPQGRSRTYFLYTVGWDKDADHNVVTGDRVEPYPGQEGMDLAEQEAWQRGQTRWVPLDRFSQ